MSALVFLFVVGGLTALLYFGGLWWTVRRLADSEHPAAAYFGSLVLRLACLLSALWLAIYYGQVLAVGAFFTGFVIARLFIVRRLADSITRTSNS